MRTQLLRQRPFPRIGRLPDLAPPVRVSRDFPGLHDVTDFGDASRAKRDDILCHGRKPAELIRRQRKPVVPAADIKRMVESELAQVAEQQINMSKARFHFVSNLRHTAGPVTSGIDEKPRRVGIGPDDVCVAMIAKVRMPGSFVQERLFTVKGQSVYFEIPDNDGRVIPPKLDDSLKAK